MPTRRASAVVLALLSVALGLQSAAAQGMIKCESPYIGAAGPPEPFSPLVRPDISIRRTEDRIVVDGNLDDPAWEDAMWVGNFSETSPGNQTEPPIDIKAGITYDESRLYVAFKVYDDPSRIRVTLTDRDKMWRDDFVAVLLDTYGDGSWAYFLASNPIGVQGDARLVTGADELEESFDILYDSQARITESGYQVEMAIPFRSLRFPAHPAQTWRVNLRVVHPRETIRVYTWAAIDRNDACGICQFGTVNGMAGVESSKGYEMLPALVGSQSVALHDEDDPRSGMESSRVRVEPSLGIKYNFSSNLVGDFTLNPDFSQVESDAAQIDVNEAFALFYPEKRPFFQEGSELFQTPIQTVYTRSINDPSVAGKATGRLGNTSLGYIGASDGNSPVIIPLEETSEYVTAGRSFSNIARVKKAFKDGNYVGLQITDRRFQDGGSGSTVGVDGQIRMSRSVGLYWQFVASHTEEPDDTTITREIDGIADLTFDHGQHTVAFDGERFSGQTTKIGLTRTSRNWNFEMVYRGISPNFRADNGFVTQSNRQRLFTWQNYSFWPKNSFFEQIRPQGIFGYEFDFDGRRRDVYLWLGALIRTKGQTEFTFSRMFFDNELFAGTDFRGMSRTWMHLESDFSANVGLMVDWTFGEMIARDEEVPVMGNGVTADAGATLKLWSPLVFEPALAYSRLDSKETGASLFDGYIFRLRSNFQGSRHLIFRLITQYDRFDDRLEVDPLVTYRINPFTAFYMGSTHEYRNFEDFGGGLRSTERQFFFKVQYFVRS